MTTIVKYECGCIGTEPDSNGDAHIIANCEEGEPIFRSRDMSGKIFTQIDYHAQLIQHAMDAQKVQIFKRALSVLGVPMYDDPLWQQLQELRRRIKDLEDASARTED